MISNISIFSGAGGLDLGIEAVGFRTLVATDIDEHSCNSMGWGKNEAIKRGKPFLKETFIQQANICEFEPQFLLDKASLRPGEADLLSGGPPCQAFSVNGKRMGTKDPRGTLVYEYLRILAGIRPKAFLFENVPGLMTIDHGNTFSYLKESLANPAEGLYYTLSVFKLNAVDYGVPEFRERLFIIGASNGTKIDTIPVITADKGDISLYPLPRWRTVRDAFKGLPPIGAAYPPNHVGRVHGARVSNRYSSMSPGERDRYTRINKLDLERPSFTIVVGSDHGGGKGHIHPTEPREVTPRESARIQTFPDWWAFSGTSRHPIRQVGNAVPPLMAAAMGNAIASNIFGYQRTTFSEYLDTLDQTHLFDEEELTEIIQSIRINTYKQEISQRQSM